MTDALTNADALRAHLTGAESDGAAQPIQALSLGGFRASNEASGLGIAINDPIRGVRVDLATAENGVGTGALVAVSVDSLAWTPPGDIQGAAVAIANGETKVIPGATASKFIRVTRTSADDLQGTATIGLARCLGTVIAQRDATVSGLTTYSAIMLRNGSALSITSLQVWIDSTTDARLFIGSEVADSLDRISDISTQGDTTAPAGVTITNQGTSAGAGLQVGTVAAGDSVGVWLKRAVEVSADASPQINQTIHWSFDYGGATYTGTASGFYRVSDASLAATPNLLYRGVNGSPDFGAPPYEIFATFPHDTAAQAPGATYHFVTRARDAYGLISQNTEETIKEIDAFGNEVFPLPSAPVETTIEAIADGAVHIASYYDYLADSTAAAATWLIYLTDTGVDPDPLLDTPVEVAMLLNGGMAELSYDSAEFADGATIKALVRVRREPSFDSTNLNIIQTTAEVDADTVAPDPACCYAVDKDLESTTRIWTDRPEHPLGTRAYIDLVDETGAFRFVIQGVAVGGLTAGRFFGYAGTLSELPYTFDLHMVENIEYDPGRESIAFAIGSGQDLSRVMEIDKDGNVRVGSVVIETGYPFAGVRTENIEQVGENLDFSADLTTVIMRLTRTAAAEGVHGSEMHTLNTTGV